MSSGTDIVDRIYDRELRRIEDAIASAPNATHRVMFLMDRVRLADWRYRTTRKMDRAEEKADTIF